MTVSPRAQYLTVLRYRASSFARRPDRLPGTETLSCPEMVAQNLLGIMRSAGEGHCLVRGWDRLVLSEGARVFGSGGHILKW